MNKKNILIILLVLLPVLAFPNCGKKGKLLKFNTQYELYPTHWQKYALFLREGKPDYIIYDSDKYHERWIYICQNKVFNFETLQEDEQKDEEEQRFKIASESLKDSGLERKLSTNDREQLKNCMEKKEEEN